jgi:hypothetical protein
LAQFSTGDLSPIEQLVDSAAPETALGASTESNIASLEAPIKAVRIEVDPSVFNFGDNQMVTLNGKPVLSSPVLSLSSPLLASSPSLNVEPNTTARTPGCRGLCIPTNRWCGADFSSPGACPGKLRCCSAPPADLVKLEADKTRNTAATSTVTAPTIGARFTSPPSPSAPAPVPAPAPAPVGTLIIPANQLSTCGVYAGATVTKIAGNNDIVYETVPVHVSHLQDPSVFGKSPSASDNSIRTITACAFQKMHEAAKKDNVVIKIASAFRTLQRQKYFYNCYQTKRCNGGRLAAKPGTSNHGKGIALDLNAKAPGVYAWLAKNAITYGFIRTVPSERWHWEFRPNTDKYAVVPKNRYDEK